MVKVFSKLGAVVITAASYFLNAAAFAYLHWTNHSDAPAFRFGAEPVLGASILMLLAYAFVWIYWISYVDMSAPIRRDEDFRAVVVRDIYGRFWFIRWLSVDLFVGSRRKQLANPEPNAASLKEAIATSIDKDCLIADVALLAVVPFLLGVTGLYSIPYNRPEFETALLREATAYFLLLVWFNALTQILLAAVCKTRRFP